MPTFDGIDGLVHEVVWYRSKGAVEDGDVPLHVMFRCRGEFFSTFREISENSVVTCIACLGSKALSLQEMAQIKRARDIR